MLFFENNKVYGLDLGMRAQNKSQLELLIFDPMHSWNYYRKTTCMLLKNNPHAEFEMKQKR